jgi:hypothetical protein
MAEGLVLFTEMIKQNPVLGVVVIVIILAYVAYIRK